ncbi:MoxR-like ATPase [Bifidobacterium margollesii]|uniref:MoxR-like ATPase n=1 Tax=Bifidobacterium margollesii TaxID=2020964 RepID=A0A2N5JCU7_9BIFI|nr:MoxR family ATPase [Bifidobacterium margollesii]PLS32032.1 MoxR-like ATPase [Bifidobacterium margollesii]
MAESEPPDTAWRGTEDAARTIIDVLDDGLACSREAVELTVTVLCAGGHLLLEDVPGVGKTTLARALGQCVGGDVRRVQFTPDMMPSDLTGVSIFDQDSRRFEFHPGPLFANIVIADEINRANPKTQSAMLEAMAERQISVDGVTHELPRPYLVLATQNPIELEGTYPLPEAQLDRFMACTSLGYPSREAERAMLLSDHVNDPLAAVRRICSMSDVLAMQRQVESVYVGESIADYIVSIVRATREHSDIRFGASPRAGLNLLSMARARAMIHRRDYVTPDDVKSLVVPVLAHRLVLRSTVGSASAVGSSSAAGSPSVSSAAGGILVSILDELPTPRADHA